MPKENTLPDETFTRFTAMTVIERIGIIENAVDVLLANFAEVDISTAAIEGSKKVAGQVASGQLAVLMTALESYAEPMPEQVWEKVYRPNVADRLDAATTTNGAKRYSSVGSRDVIVNLIKVATMGLTLAKQDPAFAPSFKSQGNLKKYANEVRGKLQDAMDPATGQPRLRSIVPKPKRLSKGRLFWLIGCETDRGIAGANTIIAADGNLDSLRRRAQRFGDKYKSYLYIEAPEEAPVLDVSAETEKPLAIQNAAVFASTL